MAEDWDQQLAVFRQSLIVLPRLVEGVSANRLRRSPAPGEWSAHVVVCHLVLDEMNTAMILRLILAQDCPSLVAIDADNSLRRYVASRGRHDAVHIDQIRAAFAC